MADGFLGRVGSVFRDIGETIGDVVEGAVKTADRVGRAVEGITTVIDVFQERVGRDPNDEVIGVGRDAPSQPPMSRERDTTEAMTRRNTPSQRPVTEVETTFNPPRTGRPGGMAPRDDDPFAGLDPGQVQQAGILPDISSMFSGRSFEPEDPFANPSPFGPLGDLAELAVGAFTGGGMADAVELRRGSGGGIQLSGGPAGFFFRAPGAGVGARPVSTITLPIPGTNRMATWKYMGRPLLYSGDLAAAKRVRRVASRAKRRVGGR